MVAKVTSRMYQFSSFALPCVSVAGLTSSTAKSLFWPPNGLNKLPEMRFEFPFILIGKSTMNFLAGQSWHVFKSWYTGGGPEGFRRCFADGLNQSLVSSVVQATSPRFRSVRFFLSRLTGEML